MARKVHGVILSHCRKYKQPEPKTKRPDPTGHSELLLPNNVPVGFLGPRAARCGPEPAEPLGRSLNSDDPAPAHFLASVGRGLCHLKAGSGETKGGWPPGSLPAHCMDSGAERSRWRPGPGLTEEGCPLGALSQTPGRPASHLQGGQPSGGDWPPRVILFLLKGLLHRNDFSPQS